MECFCCLCAVRTILPNFVKCLAALSRRPHHRVLWFVGGRLISPVRPWTSEAHFSSKWGSFRVRFLARLSGQTLLDYLVFAVWPWALPQHPPHRVPPAPLSIATPPLTLGPGSKEKRQLQSVGNPGLQMPILLFRISTSRK